MVLPFGVSVGDFICTIGLLRTIVGAILESHGSAMEYQDLVSSLQCLEAATQHLSRITCDDLELAAQLQQATDQSKYSIQKLWQKIAKYQPCLDDGGSRRKWIDALRRVQFRLIKDDILEFRIKLIQNASNVHSVLEAMKAADLQDQLIEERARANSLEAQVQELSAQVQELGRSLTAALAHYAENLGRAMKALAISCGPVVTSLSKQICFEQPLTFQDACGRHYPIQIEWTSSWDAFDYILERLFQDRPGLEAVRARNYKLQDGSTPGKWSEIDMDELYEVAFRPGGKWDMAMVFPRDEETDSGCPKCGREEPADAEPSRIECQSPACRTNYSRASDVFNEVLALPEHYDMPTEVCTVHDPIEAGQDGRDQVVDLDGMQTAIASTDHCASESVEAEETSELSNKAPTTIATTAHSSVRIEDFINIYLAKSPPVYLRALSGVWYVLPWPVFQTYEGFQFLARYFCGAKNATFALRIWNSDISIDETNWDSQVYFGMFVELIPRAESLADVSSYVASSTSTVHQKATYTNARFGPTALNCYLCRKTFFNLGSLNRHTQIHLRQAPCPSTCEICQVA